MTFQIKLTIILLTVFFLFLWLKIHKIDKEIEMMKLAVLTRASKDQFKELTKKLTKMYDKFKKTYERDCNNKS